MEILEVPWLAQRWQLWRGDASSPSQVMKAGSCCAVMKSICKNMSTGPAVDQRHWAHGRATSHEGHVVIFMKGALTESPLTWASLWSEAGMVGSRAPLVVVAVGGRSWSAVVVAIVVVGGRMLSVVACCRWSWQSVVGRGRSWWWGFSHRGQPSSRSVVIVVSCRRSQLSSW